MAVPRGSVAYPGTIDPAVVEGAARALSDIAAKFNDAQVRLDRVAGQAAATWSGEAAVTFVDHLQDRAHTLGLAVTQIRESAETLADLATVLRDNQEWYARYATTELLLREQPQARGDRIAEAIANQEQVVRDLVRADASYGKVLARVASQIDDYARSSFIPVGQHILVPCSESGTGRDLIADALDATENRSIAIDQIQIQKLSDGSYLVITPGVTDLSNRFSDMADGRFVVKYPDNTARSVPNAFGTVTLDGALNTYAEIVKMAMRRAGVPPGAEITLVGHSYGNYTAMDLAGTDAFNSADGTGDGYNVRIKRVVGVAADTDWKMKRIPKETDVIVLNSRDDAVYLSEAQLDVEADWLVRPDRILSPQRPRRPSLPGGPTVVTHPTGLPNQIEVEVSGGRAFDADDKGSGHFPGRYSPFLRNTENNPMGPLLDKMDGVTVVDRVNVRIPDRVPSVPRVK